MSLYEKILEKDMDKRKHELAIVCDELRYTYVELEELVCQMAQKLKNRGIEKGSKVILRYKNPFQFTLFLLALLKNEAIPMPVYHGISASKLEKIIVYYEINFVITEDVYGFQKGQQTEVSSCGIQFFIYNYWDGKDISLNEVKLILFTSGTTSTPKAIMLTEENIYSNVMAICKYLKIGCEDSLLLVKDLSHSSSIIGELFVGLISGCKIVLTTKLSLSSTILKILQKEKIGVFFAVPTLLKGIMNYKRLSQFDLSNLKIINFYGASMHENDILKLINIFPEVNIIYSYGQTEASPRVTYIEKEDLILHSASCGRPIENVKVSIVDDTGKPLFPYESGEIVVSGPNVMLGYYKNEDKTKIAKRDGKLYTGDLGYMDEFGFLYVTGRIDNMIISGGKNIYPEEIEGVLTTNEDISEALVISTNKENEVSELTAYVVMKEEKEFDYNKVFYFCRKHLEDYKIPKDIVVVKELQKTPSGKIKRGQFNTNVR